MVRVQETGAGLSGVGLHRPVGAISLQGQAPDCSRSEGRPCQSFGQDTGVSGQSYVSPGRLTRLVGGQDCDMHSCHAHQVASRPPAECVVPRVLNRDDIRSVLPAPPAGVRGETRQAFLVQVVGPSCEPLSAAVSLARCYDKVGVTLSYCHSTQLAVCKAPV